MKKIMSRAWEIARQAVAKFGGKVTMYIAEALRQAWAELKSPIITLVRNGYELYYNTKTGAITGETYPVKDWIKSYLGAKWNGLMKAWTVPTDITNYTGVKEAMASVKNKVAVAQVSTKSVRCTGLVNGNDGFYNVTWYTDGTSSRRFVG